MYLYFKAMLHVSHCIRLKGQGTSHAILNGLANRNKDNNEEKVSLYNNLKLNSSTLQMDKFNLRYLADIGKEKFKFGRAIGLPLGLP